MVYVNEKVYKNDGVLYIEEIVFKSVKSVEYSGNWTNFNQLKMDIDNKGNQIKPNKNF